THSTAAEREYLSVERCVRDLDCLVHHPAVPRPRLHELCVSDKRRRPRVVEEDFWSRELDQVRLCADAVEEPHAEEPVRDVRHVRLVARLAHVEDGLPDDPEVEVSELPRVN